MSKLAALAAKRRQKEIERTSPSHTIDPGSQDDYTASLNKLRISQSSEDKSSSRKAKMLQVEDAAELASEANHAEKGNDTALQRGLTDQANGHIAEASFTVPPNMRGPPSAFASIMTSHDADTQLSTSPDLSSVGAIAKSFDFAEPSPDDVVTKAQNSKGRIQS